MRKIVITLIFSTLLSATAAAPAFANGWGRPYYERGLPGGPLWPIVAALSIPAAVIDTVAHVAFPFPGVGYPATPVTAGPAVYAGPAAYYAPRGYYRERGYRTYRGGW